MSYYSEYYKKNKAKIKEKKAKYYLDNKEYLDMQHIKYNNEHKEDISKKNKELYIQNKETILIKSREYYMNNKEKHYDSVKKWMIDNREEYLEYRRNLAKEDRKKRPYFYAWRDLLKSTIRRMKANKNGQKTIDILGYSALELKNHIENKFKPGMTWENHGEWHIDHIKEIHTFDDSAPQNIVNALSNLQPLWQDENIKKYYSNRHELKSGKNIK